MVLWAVAQPARLSDRAAAQLQDRSNQLLISSISIAEMELKRSIGKLRLDHTYDDLPAALDAQWLGLTAAHAARLRDLPRHHHDPFDRLLIAQAVADDLVLMTADSMIFKYDLNLAQA